MGHYGANENEKAAIKSYPGLFICSAGNDNANTDSDVHNNYPSEYDLPNIISVGASKKDDGRRKTSNYGKETVDLFAPGEGIWTTTAKGGYASSSGTSIAAPFVTGVAALILAKEPTLSMSEIKETIIRNVDKVAAFDGLCVSGGRLNAEKALKNIHHHNFIYTSTGDLFQHRQICRTCGYETEESHTWIELANYSYKCNKCRMTTNFVPIIPLSHLGEMYEKKQDSPLDFMTEFTDYIEKHLGTAKSAQ